MERTIVLVLLEIAACLLRSHQFIRRPESQVGVSRFPLNRYHRILKVQMGNAGGVEFRQFSPDD